MIKMYFHAKTTAVTKAMKWLANMMPNLQLVILKNNH